MTTFRIERTDRGYEVRISEPQFGVLPLTKVKKLCHVHAIIDHYYGLHSWVHPNRNCAYCKEKLTKKETSND